MNTEIKCLLVTGYSYRLTSGRNVCCMFFLFLWSYMTAVRLVLLYARGGFGEFYLKG